MHFPKTLLTFGVLALGLFFGQAHAFCVYNGKPGILDAIP